MKEIRSFKYAFCGLFSAIRTEVHLRFHLVAAFYVFLFALLGKFTPLEWALTVTVVCVVLCTELINTAIEDICDLYSTERNMLIKRIKDISAGVVLVAAAAATVVAVTLFLLSGKLQNAFHLLTINPLWLIPLGISAVLSVVFVIFPFKNANKE